MMDTRKLMIDGLLEYIGQAGEEEQYVQVEWLASKGSAKIDTGVPGADNNLKIEMRFKYEGYASYKSFYGTYTNEATDCTRLILTNSDNGGLYAYLNSKASGGSTNLTLNPKTGWHDFWMTKQQTSLDGVVVATTGVSGTAASPTQTIKLFTHSATAPDTACTVYMSAFKLWDGDYPLRDFVPMVRVRDGKPGMYDRIGHKFYTNIGTGADFEYAPTGAPIFASLGYVVDGIVEVWDGQYNAVTGHDASASTWLGMIHGTPLVYEGYDTYTWENKCCHFAGTSGYAMFSKDWEDDETPFAGTLENCSAWSTVTGKGTYPMTATTAKYSTANIQITKNGAQGMNCITSMNGVQKNTSAKLSANMLYTMSVTQAAEAGAASYITYVSAAQQTISWTGQSTLSYGMFIGCSGLSSATSSGGEGRIYGVRVYNRPLTQAELQQNYAVDISRFGTTV